MFPISLVVAYVLIMCGVVVAYFRVGERKQFPVITWEMLYMVKKERMDVAQKIRDVICNQMEVKSVGEYVALETEYEDLNRLDAKLHAKELRMLAIAKMQVRRNVIA